LLLDVLKLVFLTDYLVNSSPGQDPSFSMKSTVFVVSELRAEQLVPGKFLAKKPGCSTTPTLLHPEAVVNRLSIVDHDGQPLLRLQER